MIVDLQSVEYHPCDQEISAQTRVEEKNDKSKMLVEYLFCSGNLSTTAFENFEREHFCYTYLSNLN